MQPDIRPIPHNTPLPLMTSCDTLFGSVVTQYSCVVGALRAYCACIVVLSLCHGPMGHATPAQWATPHLPNGSRLPNGPHRLANHHWRVDGARWKESAAANQVQPLIECSDSRECWRSGLDVCNASCIRNDPKTTANFQKMNRSHIRILNNFGLIDNTSVWVCGAFAQRVPSCAYS